MHDRVPSTRRPTEARVCSLRPSFRPNPNEVAELILMPLRDLIADEAITVGIMRKGSIEYVAPGFHVGEHFVWGATAMVLAELRTTIRDIIAEQQQEPWMI